MATPIRPIPVVTGDDAIRFVEAAEAAEGRVCTVLAGWELVQPLRPKPGHQRPLS